VGKRRLTAGASIRREETLARPNPGRIEEIPQEFCKGLKGILFDIDDTFTFQGRIRSGAFSALWEAKEEGLLLLPITGRPAGWADHIARMWPVDGVVGENGGFYFRLDEADKRLKKHFVVKCPADRQQNRRRLDGLFADLQRSFPALRKASDQPYRECDLAIDFCEDANPPLSLEEAFRIQKSLESRGATTKISSIHVNAWFGDYDKLSTCKWFFRQELGIDLESDKDSYFFMGDSPNDGPMFAFFPFSGGVAGIRRFRESGLLEHMPSFVASKEGAYGFEEMLHVLLRKRAGP
jgi:hydroxymethylpyrimidine pyrophosphatase-like HAD family hydrolase